VGAADDSIDNFCFNLVPLQDCVEYASGVQYPIQPSKSMAELGRWVHNCHGQDGMTMQ
jgi:hypothetical protein